MHIPIRPGSDTLLAMAMMRVILENGWEGVEYIRDYTTSAWLMHADEMTFVHCNELGIQAEGDPCVVYDAATSAFVPVGTAQDPMYVSDGTLESNGVKMRTSFDIILEDLNKYTLAEYAEMTNLPEETIVEFADVYANNGPATILTLFGFNHYGNSAYAFTAVNMLPAIYGYYNTPYAGMASYGNSGSVDMAAAWPPNRPGGPLALNAFHLLDGSVIPFSKFYDLLKNKKWNDKPINVRMLLSNCSDFLSNFANRNQNLEFISMLETFVVIDPFMTDTARYADYVLPASFWYEQEDAYLAYFQSSPYAYFNEKAIEPLYESKPDFDIFNLLLDAMDLSECKVESPREWIRLAMDTDANRAIDATAERLFEEKVLRNYYPAREFIDPKPMGPMTWVAESSVFAPKWYDGQELDTHDLQKLSWVEPHEAWYANELHGKYPFSTNSHRGRYRTSYPVVGRRGFARVRARTVHSHQSRRCQGIWHRGRRLHALLQRSRKLYRESPLPHRRSAWDFVYAARLAGKPDQRGTSQLPFALLP